MYKLRMLLRHKYLENPDEPVTHKSRFLYVLFASLLVPVEKHIYQISFFFAPFVFAIVVIILGFPLFLGLAVYDILRASIWSYIDVEGLEDETEAQREAHPLLPISGPSRPNPPSS